MLRYLGMPWDFVFILAMLGVLVPWRGAVRVRELLSRPYIAPSDRVVLYASTSAFQWFAAAVAFWRCREHGFSAASLGLVHGNLSRTIAVALGVALLLALVQWMGFRRLRQQSLPEGSRIRQIMTKLMPSGRNDSLAFIALVCTASVCEEFLYRGFAFAAIYRAAGNSLATAVIGSSALFALAHSYQGRAGLLNTFVLGLLFAVCRVWTMSLWPAMLAHLVVDLIAGLLIPRAVRVNVAAMDSVGNGHIL
ncbi:MAG TPA: CPBP family intramembrane glutamic endopeptidase [Methylomirabilota bacterium]|nr:CPBP family intramembrane glutamic endopeptidase [Methylomirabilota bacterium]